jgi:2-polyprenyl-6-methoxyphenol hydroxylase-like FAD-dependent oxidoreductase
MFRQDPNQAAADMWPGLQFPKAVDYIFWGVLAQQHLLAVSDYELNTMSGPDLQRLVLALSENRPQALRTLIEQCRPDDTFVLKMRFAKPVEHWQTSNITLLGDAIHVMPPNGSGANTALRDASILARSLISVVHQGIPLHQALHDYEVEMLRYGFDAVRAFSQRGGPNSPFRPLSRAVIGPEN